MTGPTIPSAPLSTAPDRRPTARLAGALILASLVLAFAQSYVYDLPEPVPSLVAIASAVALAVAVLALARLRAAGTGRAGRFALVQWAVAVLLQGVVALDARFEVDGVSQRSATVDWVWQLVTVAWLVTLLLGPIVAGVYIVRAGVLTGWRRWVPLAYAIVFVLDFLLPMLGIQALLSFIGIPMIALFVLFAVALLTAFRGDARTGDHTTDSWTRSGTVLETP